MGDTQSPKIVPMDGFIVKIACGRNHALALTKEGVVFAWHLDGKKVFRPGEPKDHSRPIPVEIPANIVHIATGHGYSLVFSDNDEIFGWGDNYDGELGNISVGKSSTPLPIDITPKQCSSQKIGEDVMALPRGQECFPAKISRLITYFLQSFR